MIYITGDTHADFSRFTKRQRCRLPFELTEKDIVIVCGDFGLLWERNDKTLKYNLVYCIIDISLNNLPVFPSNCVDFAQRCHRIASFSRLVDEKTFCVI